MLATWIGLFCGQGLKALARNKLRSALAALGITIGTAAVVCVVSIGRAGSAKAEAQLASLGDNFVWVEAGGRNINGVRTGTHGTNSLTLDVSMARDKFCETWYENTDHASTCADRVS